MESLQMLLGHHSPATWAMILIAVVAGGIVRGLTGFGAALLMAPLFSLVMSARDTMCLITVLSLFPLSPSSMRLANDEMDASVVWPLTLAATAALAPGVWLGSWVPGELFGPVIGAAVMASALVLMSGVRLPNIRSRLSSSVVGLLSGLLTGFSGVGGPPAILYLMGIEPNSYRARANFVIFFAVLYPVSCVLLVLTGVMPFSILIAGIALFPLFHIGGWVGVKMYQRISRHFLRRMVLILLLLAGGIGGIPFMYKLIVLIDVKVWPT